MDKDGYHGYDKPVIDESAAKRIATALGWEPQRTWVGLTYEDKESFWTADQMTQEEWGELFNAIEAKLKEKNT
jgi:hypothetical protein